MVLYSALQWYFSLSVSFIEQLKSIDKTFVHGLDIGELISAALVLWITQEEQQFEKILIKIRTLGNGCITIGFLDQVKM